MVSLRRHIQEQESVERRDPFVSLLQHHLPPSKLMIPIENSCSSFNNSQMLIVALHITIISPFCSVGNDSGGVSTVLTGAAAAALHKRSRSYNSSRPSYKYRGDESGKRRHELVLLYVLQAHKHNHS